MFVAVLALTVFAAAAHGDDSLPIFGQPLSACAFPAQWCGMMGYAAGNIAPELGCTVPDLQRWAQATSNDLPNPPTSNPQHFIDLASACAQDQWCCNADTVKSLPTDPNAPKPVPPVVTPTRPGLSSAKWGDFPVTSVGARVYLEDGAGPCVSQKDHSIGCDEPEYDLYRTIVPNAEATCVVYDGMTQGGNTQPCKMQCAQKNWCVGGVNSKPAPPPSTQNTAILSTATSADTANQVVADGGFASGSVAAEIWDGGNTGFTQQDVSDALLGRGFIQLTDQLNANSRAHRIRRRNRATRVGVSGGTAPTSVECHIVSSALLKELHIALPRAGGVCRFTPTEAQPHDFTRPFVGFAHPSLRALNAHIRANRYAFAQQHMRQTKALLPYMLNLKRPRNYTTARKHSATTPHSTPAHSAPAHAAPAHSAPAAAHPPAHH